MKVTKQALKCYAKLIFAAPEKERLNYQRNLAEIQQAMKEEEIIETTFPTYEDHYEFLVIPFCLCNAQSTL